jgi:vacuolar-type H+-ATPase subunit H
MRIEGDSISADAEEEAAGDDGLAGGAPPTHGGPQEPSTTADKFARIIEDAQSSTQEFLDTVRRQSQSILEEAEEEARKHRAELIEQAQDRVEALISTTDEMLRDAERLQSDLESVAQSLRTSAGRLRSHVDDLIGDTGPAGDPFDGVEDDLGNDEEPSDEGAGLTPPNRRRFGLR